MISSQASLTTRRISIILLAFAVAVGVAVATDSASAHADSTNGDDKDYSATVTATTVPGSATDTFTVTFKNEDTNTFTQRAGSFFVDFGSAGFIDVAVAESETNPRTSSGVDWELVSETNGLIVISAVSGGERIGVGETVSVDVMATAPAWSLLGGNDKVLATGGDQEAHGDFGGGNAFTLQSAPPTITVTFDGQFAECIEGEDCTTEPDGTVGSATAECKPAADSGCGKDGVVAVDFLEGLCDEGGEFAGQCAAIWFADTTTGSGPNDYFYVVIEAPEDLQRPSILLEDGTGGLVEAKNCQPPKREFNCIDIKHPDYDKRGGTFPVKLEAKDPRIAVG